MTRNIINLDLIISPKLWDEYVEVDYGRDEPDRESKYTGFGQFIAYKTKASVTTLTKNLYVLEFDTDEELVMFKLIYEQTRSVLTVAGWSSWSARVAHNHQVVGSNPAPATKYLVIFEHSSIVLHVAAADYVIERKPGVYQKRRYNKVTTERMSSIGMMPYTKTRPNVRFRVRTTKLRDGGIQDPKFWTGCVRNLGSNP